MDKELYITKSKEILEMQLQAEELRKVLGQPCNEYFIEKATSALRCLNE